MKLKELKDLVKLANSLDAKGLYKEADGIDQIILKISEERDEIVNNLEI